MIWLGISVVYSLFGEQILDLANRAHHLIVLLGRGGCHYCRC